MQDLELQSKIIKTTQTKKEIKMKKNIDPNKVSNFKNHQPSYHKYSSFCMKTKPNNRYFKGELKRLTQQMRDTFCTEELKKRKSCTLLFDDGQKVT